MRFLRKMQEGAMVVLSAPGLGISSGWKLCSSMESFE